MADKDKIEKVLENYNDVFADIYNTLLFQEPFLKEENLDFGATESIYKAETGQWAKQCRDVLKTYRNNQLCIFSLGMENQSFIDKNMPIRIMGYDYTAYRALIANAKPLAPVITIVLNFTETRWNQPKNLLGLMDNVPEKLKPFIQDYEIKVFDIAFLDDETIESFTSDFKAIARFFKKKRLGELDAVSDHETALKHVEAVLDLLQVFTHDNRYKEAYENGLREKVEKGDEVYMCTVIDMYEQRGLEKGIEEGLHALVQSLKKILPDFSAVYDVVIQNEIYANVTKEQVEKYFKE